MRTWWGVLIVVAVAVVAFAGSGMAEAAKPGGGKGPPAPDPAETIEVISGILAVAQAEMANIAEEFVANAPSAESQSDFDAMQDTAEYQIGLAYGVAGALLREIRDEAESGPVYHVAVSALQELDASRDAALAVVESVEYVDPATTTDATMSPSTTTTTPVPTSTTTTTPVPTSTTTTTTAASPTSTTSAPQPPSSGSATTSVPDLPSTTALPRTTTTTAVPGVSTTTTTPAAIVAAEGRSGGGGGQLAVAIPPEDGLLAVTVPDPDSPSPVADLTGRVASMLDIVLPPMVVTGVLSPLMIFEVIGRTILRSGSAILVPMLLLGLSIAFLRWRDQSRGTARISRDDGSEAAQA